MYGNVWFICVFSFVCLDMKSKNKQVTKNDDTVEKKSQNFLLNNKVHFLHYTVPFQLKTTIYVSVKTYILAT